jgi:4-hydroxybenzoate polyprenyltransferase
MTTRQKSLLEKIAAHSGWILSILMLVSFCYATLSGVVDRYVDKRIDKRNEYIVLLLEEIATDQQKENAKKKLEYMSMYKGNK